MYSEFQGYKNHKLGTLAFRLSRHQAELSQALSELEATKGQETVDICGILSVITEGQGASLKAKVLQEHA